MPPEDEKVVEEKKEEAKPVLDTEELKAAIFQEIDARIGARDQALLENVTKLLTAQPRAEVKEVAKDESKIEISSEDFWRDPATALNKFFEAKVRPAIAEQKPKEKDGDEPDSGLIALIETKKMKLKEAVGETEFKKYGPYFENVVTRVDPSLLKDDRGMDAVWRLTKSYADEFIANEETKRQSKLSKAKLESGNSPGTGAGSEPVVLTDDERVVAQSMGISPELYKQYGKPEEIEIGSGRKKK